MTESSPDFEGLNCPLPLPHQDRIVLGHGSGGRMSHDLITRLFFPPFSNPILRVGDDSGVFSLEQTGYVPGSRLAISTDSHVVMPLFFPGGDIGRLAICGTVNDIVMMGSKPLYLTTGFVLEEGLEVEILNRVIESMREACLEANVHIIAGDTKVVQKGKADGLFINTTGIGIIPSGVNISGANARPGDAVILSGSIGDHGIAVLAARGELNFETKIMSDVAPLNGLVDLMLKTTSGIHVMRDPTRGGLATTLNEIAIQSKVGIQIDEEALVVKPAVTAACEMLGFDPLYVANEGKLIAIVDQNYADGLLSAMRQHPQGTEAAIIGIVTDTSKEHVMLRTAYGTTRIIDMLSGEMLPRIC